MPARVDAKTAPGPGDATAQPSQPGSSTVRRAGASRGPGRQLLWLLAILIAIDLLFVELHRLHLRGLLGLAFSLQNETSYAEWYQHAKELAIAVLAASLAARGDRLYAAWAWLFTYLFLDDTFELHERLGAWIGGYLAGAQRFGVRGADIGELLVSGAVGLMFLLLLALAWRRGTSAARDLTRTLFVLLLALGTFGVLIDTLHAFVRSGPWHYRLGMLEDGGEMLVISTMLWLVCAASRAGKAGEFTPHAL